MKREKRKRQNARRKAANYFCHGFVKSCHFYPRVHSCKVEEDSKDLIEYKTKSVIIPMNWKEQKNVLQVKKLSNPPQQHSHVQIPNKNQHYPRRPQYVKMQSPNMIRNYPQRSQKHPHFQMQRPILHPIRYYPPRSRLLQNVLMQRPNIIQHYPPRSQQYPHTLLQRPNIMNWKFLKMLQEKYQ